MKYYNTNLEAFYLCVCLPYPMNMKRTMAAVMRAPLLAGESIPNIANTGTYQTTQIILYIQYYLKSSSLHLQYDSMYIH